MLVDGRPCLLVGLADHIGRERRFYTLKIPFDHIDGYAGSLIGTLRAADTIRNDQYRYVRMIRVQTEMIAVLTRFSGGLMGTSALRSTVGTDVVFHLITSRTHHDRGRTYVHPVATDSTCSRYREN